MRSSRKKETRNRRLSPGQGEAPAPRSVKSVLPEVFDIPGSALLGVTHIELSDNREAIVDGCKGVLEYNETVIRLSTGKMSVKFCGRNLQIKVLTQDSAVVSGFITSMEFLT